MRPRANPPLNHLLTAAQMAAADQETIQHGTPGQVLMENAGKAVVSCITNRYAPRRTLVLCGPGNNGGDGLVVARLLGLAGWEVSVATFSGTLEGYQGDAATMAGQYDGNVYPITPQVLDSSALTVDALFGTGLTRPISGPLADSINALAECSVPVIAVDIPSGICSDTGAVLGTAVRATHTVTFASRKRGHVLMPGRNHCGMVTVADIGIARETIEAHSEPCMLHHPIQWLAKFPWPEPRQHKYQRGHSLVFGGPADKSGAARLAAYAALRLCG